MIKHSIISATLCLTLLAVFSSCGYGGEQSKDRESGKIVPRYDKGVLARIDSVKFHSWDSKNYVEIRDNLIPRMKGRKKQQESQTLLKRNACFSIESDLYRLMENNCAKNHKKMASLYSELTGKEFKDVETGDPQRVRAAYVTHKKLLDQLARHAADPKVASFRDPYDMSYDSTTKQASQAMYRENKEVADRCSYLKNGLTNISFRHRHQLYCEAIVASYEEVKIWDEGNENIVLAHLDSFRKEFYNTSNWQNWNARIEAVKRKLVQE